jgi:dTDP-D-glucose 4,6-dehydratase
MTPRRVLMTGASGFIGSSVLAHLLERREWEIVCVSSWRHKGSSQRLTLHPRMQVVTHDLVGPIPDLGRFDFILNLASESHVDRSIAQPVAFIENNVSSTLQVLEYARRYPPELLIQFSTDEVYGATNHAEWDVLLPSNPYAASKAAQEMIAIAYWSTFGVPVVITNSNNVVGPGQDPEKFIPKVIGLVGRGEPVPIHMIGGRPGRRHYNSVRNVADALLFILDHIRQPEPRGDRPPRFSIPGGAELDNREMAIAIAHLMERPLSVVEIDAEAIRPGYDEFYGPAEGLLSQLGWYPPYTLKDELRRIIHGSPAALSRGVISEAEARERIGL